MALVSYILTSGLFNLFSWYDFGWLDMVIHLFSISLAFAGMRFKVRSLDLGYQFGLRSRNYTHYKGYLRLALWFELWFHGHRLVFIIWGSSTDH